MVQGFKNLKQVRILVSGRVQGVFFRSRTKDVADKLGVTGWVRNLPDGRVEVLAAGEKHLLDQLISWCKKGPIFAEVRKVKVDWQAPKEFFDNFETIY